MKRPIRTQTTSKAQVTKYRMIRGRLRADVPAETGPQIGDPVDATRPALPGDESDLHDPAQGLRDQGEVNAPHPPFKHGRADDVGQQSRNQEDQAQCHREAFERVPDVGQLGDLVPVHEVRESDRGQGPDLVAPLFTGDVSGRFELEESGHAVTAESPEESLPEA